MAPVHSNRPPRSPFATSLSGSAREIELRIRNILSGPKKRPPNWLIALTSLVILACGSLVSCQPMEPPAPDGSFSADFSSSDASAEPLEFADQFERYNEMLKFDGIAQRSFLFSQGEQDGVPCYRMENGPYGVVILAVPGGKAEPYQATLFYEDRTLSFELPIFPLGYGNASGVAHLYLEDLTGDGTPELVYIYGGGGTGLWHDDVQVFDLSDMTVCPVAWDLSTMEQSVQSQLVGTREGKYDSRDAVFRITGPDGASFLVPSPLGYEGMLQESPLQFGYSDSISLQDGRLTLCSSFGAELQRAIGPSTLGTLTGELAYDPGARAFTLQPPFTLHIFDSIEDPDAVEPIIFSAKADIWYAAACVISPAERDLPQEQRDHLLALDPKTLPREPVDLYTMLRSEIFDDRLVPMAWDEKADVTLYGVIDPESIPDKEPTVIVPSDFLSPKGVAVRHGDKLAYFPLVWEGNAWSCTNPWLSVSDWDGDGKDEAAVCLFSGHGTGVSAENLYFIDLDTMDWSVPDCSTLDIGVTYDPDTHTCTLSSGDHTFQVPLPDYMDPPKGVDCGNIIDFFQDDGVLFFRGVLDFSGMTTGYLAEVTAPVVFEEGRYRLDPVSSLDPLHD